VPRHPQRGLHAASNGRIGQGAAALSQGAHATNPEGFRRLGHQVVVDSQTTARASCDRRRHFGHLRKLVALLSDTFGARKILARLADKHTQRAGAALGRW